MRTQKLIHLQTVSTNNHFNYDLLLDLFRCFLCLWDLFLDRDRERRSLFLELDLPVLLPRDRDLLRLFLQSLLMESKRSLLLNRPPSSGSLLRDLPRTGNLSALSEVTGSPPSSCAGGIVFSSPSCCANLSSSIRLLMMVLKICGYKDIEIMEKSTGTPMGLPSPTNALRALLQGWCVYVFVWLLFCSLSEGRFHPCLD